MTKQYRLGAQHRIRNRMRVDWFRVLADLQYLGLSNYDVSQRLGIAKRTIGGWKAGAEPRHCDGEELIALWVHMTSKPREGLPMERAGFRRLT